MKKMTSEQLRREYINFFIERGHREIASASLIPENDPTVLFTTAGMHPLVPYLMGEKHPLGTRLTDIQKCVRTGDIDEVGDSSHCTFFEMLGNWSLGDYFKKEAISWSFEFLTKVLEIPVERLAFSVFGGNEDCGKDEESAALWISKGVKPENVFYLPKENNWWGPASTTGPCGPDTEMFVDTGKPKCSEQCSPACSCGKYLEIWNDVFMQFYKTAEGKYVEMEHKNVDTGMGLERTLCILNGKTSVYETDLFEGAIKLIEELSGKKYGDNEADTKAIRIVADHIRTATMILGDQRAVTPSNVLQGYVLRRLIRRAVRYGRMLGIESEVLTKVSNWYINKYKEQYPELAENEAFIYDELTKEASRFDKTLLQGMKMFEKILPHCNGVINGKAAFRLYDTFGFPLEMTIELAKEANVIVDEKGYHECFAEHQKTSSQGSDKLFKGGVESVDGEDGRVACARLHTATHIMHEALRRTLHEEVEQRGSNITPERMRFDFKFDRPLTKEEISEVENTVNDIIKQNVEVTCREMTVKEAKDEGAIGIFDSKYGDVVKVYAVGDFSKEICGGPHAARSGELGKFVIQKEQSSSAGVRRIRAVLVNE